MEASDRDIQEVERLERSFGEAITRGDAAALDRLLADDFVGTNPLARVLDKNQTMAELGSPDYELDLPREPAAELHRSAWRGRCRGKRSWRSHPPLRAVLRQGGPLPLPVVQ
jgi:hypothetical protein